MKDRLDVVCPCCSTKLTIERASGEILAEERPKQDAEKTFEGAMGQVQSGAQRREDAFSKAFKRTQRMEDILTKKFEEAKKKADSDPDAKPPSPFDSD
jgi:hypothetical protein